MIKWFCLFLILAAQTALADAPFTFESLMDLINTKHITSIDQLIPQLPDDLRQNYTYIKDSMSTQDASFDFPRALLFGKDARLLITFNGSSTQAGYQRLEVIQFRDDKREFEFRDVDFSMNPPRPSEGNPHECMGCHTGLSNLSPRPNWSSYPSWPGTFGAHDDRLEPGEDSKLSEISKLPRYSALYHPQDNLLYPYSTEYKGDSVVRPNFRFSELLIRLNAQRLARIIESPKYAAYKGAVLFTAANCAPSERDKSILSHIIDTSKYPRQKYEYYDGDYSYLSQILQALGISGSDWSMHYRESDYNDRRNGMFGSPYFSIGGYNSIHQLVAYHLAHDISEGDSDFGARLDASVQFFNDKANYSSSSYPNILTHEQIEILNSLGLSLTNKSLLDYPDQEHVLKDNCDLFSDYMAKTMQNAAPPVDSYGTSLERPSSEHMDEILNRKCSTCHNGILAPYIPFQYPSELKKSLGDKGYPHGTLMDEILFRVNSQTDPKVAMPRLAPEITDVKILRQQITNYIMRIGPYVEAKKPK